VEHWQQSAPGIGSICYQSILIKFFFGIVSCCRKFQVVYVAKINCEKNTNRDQT
jgi:hypothetical protein